MAKYIIKFSKEGSICYISHLDLLRLFKRAMKRAGILLTYSQGFNPHPKLGFAQPLSLGYSSIGEYLEFETSQDYETEWMKEKIQEQMPDGIRIYLCRELEQNKNLAALTIAAEYIIGIPMHRTQSLPAGELCDKFLAQKNIFVPKRQKKTKKMVDVDIRNKIQFLQFLITNENLIITTTLDSGSHSNLSPELLILAVQQFLKLDTDRSEMEVMRTKIIFDPQIQI